MADVLLENMKSCAKLRTEDDFETKFTWQTYWERDEHTTTNKFFDNDTKRHVFLVTPDGPGTNHLILARAVLLFYANEILSRDDECYASLPVIKEVIRIIPRLVTATDRLLMDDDSDVEEDEELAENDSGAAASSIVVLVTSCPSHEYQDIPLDYVARRLALGDEDPDVDFAGPFQQVSTSTLTNVLSKLFTSFQCLASSGLDVSSWNLNDVFWHSLDTRDTFILSKLPETSVAAADLLSKLIKGVRHLEQALGLDSTATDEQLTALFRGNPVDWPALASTSSNAVERLLGLEKVDFSSEAPDFWPSQREILGYTHSQMTSNPAWTERIKHPNVVRFDSIPVVKMSHDNLTDFAGTELLTKDISWNDRSLFWTLSTDEQELRNQLRHLALTAQLVYESPELGYYFMKPQKIMLIQGEGEEDNMIVAWYNLVICDENIRILPDEPPVTAEQYIDRLKALVSLVAQVDMNPLLHGEATYHHPFSMGRCLFYQAGDDGDTRACMLDPGAMFKLCDPRMIDRVSAVYEELLFRLELTEDDSSEDDDIMGTMSSSMERGMAVLTNDMMTTLETLAGQSVDSPFPSLPKNKISTVRDLCIAVETMKMEAAAFHRLLKERAYEQQHHLAEYMTTMTASEFVARFTYQHRVGETIHHLSELMHDQKTDRAVVLKRAKPSLTDRAKTSLYLLFKEACVYLTMAERPDLAVKTPRFMRFIKVVTRPEDFSLTPEQLEDLGLEPETEESPLSAVEVSFYLMFEYLAWDTVDELVKRRHTKPATSDAWLLDDASLDHVATELERSLNELSIFGLAHGNLTGGDVLISDKGEVALSDFTRASCLTLQSMGRVARLTEHIAFFVSQDNGDPETNTSSSQNMTLDLALWLNRDMASFDSNPDFHGFLKVSKLLFEAAYDHQNYSSQLDVSLPPRTTTRIPDSQQTHWATTLRRLWSGYLAKNRRTFFPFDA